MKKALILLVAMFFLTGCADFDPRNNMPINNENGSIDEIKNNQNGVMAEIGKLKQHAEIQDSKLREIQNGLVNLNAAISRNENSGVQILQGDGSLMLIFSLAVIAMILYYRNKVAASEKTAKIMADEIAKFNDPVLNDNVLRSALYNGQEVKMFKMLTKKS